FGENVVDCLNMIDIDDTKTLPSDYIPVPDDERIKANLPQDSSCVMTVQIKPDDNHFLKANKTGTCSNSVPYPLSSDEGSRYFRRGNDNRVYCQQVNHQVTWSNILLTYFDGDKTAPGAISNNY